MYFMWIRVFIASLWQLTSKRRKKFLYLRLLDTELERKNPCYGSTRKNNDGEVFMTRKMYKVMGVQRRKSLKVWTNNTLHDCKKTIDYMQFVQLKRYTALLPIIINASKPCNNT